MNEQKLETVTSFKYLGSIITDEGSKPEILFRIAQTTAAFTKLKGYCACSFVYEGMCVCFRGCPPPKP